MKKMKNRFNLSFINRFFMVSLLFSDGLEEFDTQRTYRRVVAVNSV